ncbi:UNVERIFIED_CONTAM: putative mitochondrial protein [Sesamum latifolium]|uniref:Mitochondrial protein n=1 Tax=Sesamum latifolium TaxID=2727402 RepID=A0AAW2WCK3_9LAMI
MTLKHQKGRLTLDDLMIAISIEEEHRNQTHKMPVERHLRLDTGPSFVLAKRPRLGRQLSIWLWEAIAGRTVSMGNFSTAEVLRIGSVDLKFPSRRILSLKRVHHVPTVRRNIIIGSESDEPRRSKRARVVKDFGSDFVTYNIEDDPVTFKDAMASSEAKQWKEAVKSEMDSIVSNGTWVLVDLPPGCTTIGCKWIFKKKLKPDGSVDKLKARLVAKGFKQKEGIDYFDTYSPDMGEADVILGIKLIRSTDGIAISQSHYVEKIIEKFGYQTGRIAKIPYDSSVAFIKNESGVLVVQLRFPAIIEGYSDASWIAKNSESNGCSGYVFTLDGGAVSWKSAKQTLITRSTFEVELCALDTTGTEVKWLFGLLSQLSIVSQPLPSIAIHCDSQTTITKVRSCKYNQKTKQHIQVRVKSIRALVSDRVVNIDFVGTKDNVANLLTKDWIYHK